MQNEYKFSETKFLNARYTLALALKSYLDYLHASKFVLGT